MDCSVNVLATASLRATSASTSCIVMSRYTTSNRTEFTGLASTMRLRTTVPKPHPKHYDRRNRPYRRSIGPQAMGQPF
jgi:phosphatidate phosphatase APP1